MLCDDSDEDDEIEDKTESIDDMLDVSFKITSQWKEHYNADVTIKNVSGEAIDDWELEFKFKDEIENIWNATVTSHEGEVYTVRNADWNQDIPVDGEVSFGMTVKYTDVIEFPEEMFLTKECVVVDENCKIEYIENSKWDNYVNGQIVITNNTDHRIEDWKLDIISNLEIENIWNAKIVSKYEDIYRIDNANYNQNIEMGQSVEFGFIAKVDGKEVSIDNYVLSEMFATELEDEDVMEEVDEDTSDGDGSFFDDSQEEELEETLDDYWDLTYPEGFEFESDDFDTYEEYEEYLKYIENQKNTLSNVRPRLFMTERASSSANSNTKKVFYRHKFNFVNQDGDKLTKKLKARQSYCTVGNKVYMIAGQKKSDKYKKTYISFFRKRIFV